MYSCRPLHMDKQRQDDQLEPTYSSSLPIRDVVLKTCRKQWTIGRGGERGLGISVLMVRNDDDDDFSLSFFFCLIETNLCIPCYLRFHILFRIPMIFRWGWIFFSFIVFIFLFCIIIRFLLWYYLPTPTLGQDMTQGQFISGV